MKAHIITGISAGICLAMASCVPYTDPDIKQGNPEPKIENLTPEQLRAKQEEEIRRKAAEEELLRQQNLLNGNTTNNNNNTPPPIQNPNPDYPFANKVPGKEGFVFSPYNNKVVDVRGIPTGTLVADPTYAASEKKYFRVP